MPDRDCDYLNFCAAVQHERKPLANQFNKREITDDSGPASPSSLFGTSDLSSIYNRQGYQVFDSNSYQGKDPILNSNLNSYSKPLIPFLDEEESESAGETESSERSVVAKAIEAISHVITSEVRNQ